MYSLLAIILTFVVAITLIVVFASVIGLLFKIAIIIVAAAIIYRIYLNYKMNK
ncbi:hypothetical protein [Miniphocaeibacter halophilus]|uniref:Uncharacterized protein n=1 Tax=Miniphocaeibacter halophilus TaxID=2931922 RepID=A0AC61MRU1_9FIRM|nr:hypothetical protein [Miniphocaeibacter halophilus]QQK08287.1 hypothetical protein JFY71_01735 [Miniphocaeibacter halophilus]